MEEDLIADRDDLIVALEKHAYRRPERVARAVQRLAGVCGHQALRREIERQGLNLASLETEAARIAKLESDDVFEVPSPLPMPAPEELDLDAREAEAFELQYVAEEEGLPEA